MFRRSKSLNSHVSLPPLDVAGNKQISGQKPEPPAYIQKASKSSSVSPSPVSPSQRPHDDPHQNVPALAASRDSQTSLPPQPVIATDSKTPPVPLPHPLPPGAVTTPSSSPQFIVPLPAPGVSASVNIPPLLQAVVPYPPLIPKVLPKAHGDQNLNLQSSKTQADEGQKCDQIAVQDRMTDAYVHRWSPVQDDIERTIEEIKSVIQSLKSVEPTSLLSNSAELAPRFILLHKAVVTQDLNHNVKEKILQIFLDNGWSNFLAAHLKVFQFVESCDSHSAITAVENLVKGLEILRQPTRHLSAQISGQIFDHHFTTVYDGLRDPSMVKARSGSQKSPAYKILSALISTLQDFVRINEIRDEKLTEDAKIKVKALCTEYVAALEDGSDLIFMCNRALAFLDDEHDFPQLPITYLSTAKGADANLERHIEDIEYVVKRLASVNVEVHIAQPWKYQYDFSFMFSAVPTRNSLSTKSANQVMAAILKDGLWVKTIINLYTAVFINNGGFTSFTAQTICVVMNIRNGLGTMINGTDFCKDAKLLQQAFDQLADFLVDQMKSESTRMSRMSPEEMNTEGSHGVLLSTTMLVILQNFSYYHEPSVSMLREKGMISIARNIQKECKNARVKTACLLIIAYLMNESDDRKMMKITDDELSLLIEELKKAMLPKQTSGYHPEELIDGLNRIAVSDDNKEKLIERGVLRLLAESLDPRKAYTPAHKASAIKAIWNLSFSEESRKEIMAVKGLMEALKSLRNSEHEEIRAAAAGALWQLEEKEKHIADAVLEPFKENKERHIMFSYNHQAKEEVHKMKEMLRQIGYKVWIDTEQITKGDSILEAMSNGIEGSCLVLIFVSEPYKNSVNCRAEAEYVFERQKPFIPIQVQSGYKPDGWLGPLCGSKYRYTLSRPDKYESEVSGLLGKVKELTSGQSSASATIDVLDAPHVSTAAPNFTSPSVNHKAKLECESWSCEQIQEWVKENELDKYMWSLCDLDGEMLAELVRLSCYHKEIFYKVISKTEGISSVDIIRFNRAVQKLANIK